MKVLELERQDIDLKKFRKRSAKESDADTIIEEDTLIIVDGEPVLLYTKIENLEEVRKALLAIPYGKHKRTNGLQTTSTIFGYMPRNAVRANYCHVAKVAETHGAAHKTIEEMGRRLEEIYKANFPETYEYHRGETESKVLDEWKINETVFTSGIVNKNNPLKYHFDSGNYKGVMSNMLALRKGTQGGRLVVPELGIKLEIADGSLTIFNGQKLLHGVTPIYKENKQAYRFTVVYYSLKGMWNCEPFEEELERVKDWKTEVEKKRAEPRNETEQ